MAKPNMPRTAVKAIEPWDKRKRATGTKGKVDGKVEPA
jgi:hypothetical protein